MASGTEAVTHMLSRPPSRAARLLRGQVVFWDGTNGHVVQVAGAALKGLPILVSAGTPAVGDVVAILRDGGSYLILGKITT